MILKVNCPLKGVSQHKTLLVKGTDNEVTPSTGASDQNTSQFVAIEEADR